MRQTTIWDFLPQESSNEAKPTNQRNTMNFESLDDLIEFLKQQSPKSESVGNTEPFTPDAEPDSDYYCIDCQLAELESRESLLLASVNVNILEVIQNTLNQEAPIRNEQADTLVKLAQVKSILGNC